MIKALLWDFGDTLVDERWMLAAPAGCAGWPAIYRDLLYETALADDWMIGNVDKLFVARVLAERVQMEVQNVIEHMKQASRCLTFFDGVLNYAKKCSVPQAIVTLNPDLFSEIVVPHYRLAATFPVIVASWEEQTLDKVQLCDIALARQGRNIQRSEALLIDNKTSNIAKWRSAGGLGYAFTTEGAFLANPPDQMIG